MKKNAPSLKDRLTAEVVAQLRRPHRAATNGEPVLSATDLATDLEDFVRAEIARERAACARVAYRAVDRHDGGPLLNLGRRIGKSIKHRRTA